MKGTHFRIYPDGKLVPEDAFKRDRGSNYTTYFIPDLVTAYLIKKQELFKCSFCGKHSKGKLVGGEGARICFNCITEKKKELDKEEKK